mgnify:FL=1
MEQDTLERPAVADQPETAVATLPPETRAVLALNSSKTELDLRALATKHVTIVEIKDRAGREQAHGAAMELMRARTSIEKVSKDARDDATRFSKAVIAEEKRLVGIVEAEEKRLKGLRDDWDEAEQKRREAAAAAERARVLAITNRIAEINQKAILAGQCRTADAIQRLIDALEKADMTGLEEYDQEAQTARSAALMSMSSLRDAKRAEEDERARIKAEQEAEAARLAEERAEIARREAAALEAEANAKAELNAAKARLDEQRQALMQEQADFEAEKTAKLAAEQKVMDPSVGIGELMPKDMAPEVPLLTVVIHGLPESIAQFEVAGDVEYIAVGGNGPSDADVIFTAARAVSLEYGLTIGDAIHRLAAVESWTQTEGETA